MDKTNKLEKLLPKYVVKDRWVDEKSPVAQTLKKCNDCAIRECCGKFEREKRCFYQIQNLNSSYRKVSALTSGDPRDLLADIQTTIDKLEEVIHYYGGGKRKPSKRDLKELAFLKLQVYEMLYGRKQPLLATQVNVSAPATLDVKELMKELRGKELKEEENEV